MEPYYAGDLVTLYHGDCLDVLRELPDGSVDSVCTDPPYGLEFMGKGWDAPWVESGINADAAFGAVEMSDGHNRLPRPTYTGSTNPKCLVCKGTRRGRRDGTAKVAVCVCADGGHFPNVRAVEMRAFGQWCSEWVTECLRVLKPGGYLVAFGGSRTWHRLACAVEDAGFEVRDSIAWLYGSGFPKSLNLGDKWQGWGTALKPAFEPIVVGRKPLAGTVAQNVQAYGTGALNIDGCRTAAAAGRWPTNVVLDDSQASLLDEQTGVLLPADTYGDRGGASRFFPTFRYEAKAPSSERPIVDGVQHPTVKPLELMRWLVRLVTPPGGIVLDPFAGSGTTAEACVLEHMQCITIERETDYLPLIVERLTKPLQVGFDFEATS